MREATLRRFSDLLLLRLVADCTLGKALQSINRAENSTAAVVKAAPQQHAQNKSHDERPELHGKVFLPQLNLSYIRNIYLNTSSKANGFIQPEGCITSASGETSADR